MDFGQLRNEQRMTAQLMTYQNSGYVTERIVKKTIVLDVIDNDTSIGTTPLTSPDTFTVTLQDHLNIDKVSEIYLDTFITYDSITTSTDRDSIAFILDIDEFRIKTNSNVANNVDKIIIPNETSADNTGVIHKNKKLNYICTINPCKLTTLTGKITVLDGGAAFAETAKARFIAEFVIIARD
jgi:hypothetical protein